MPGFSGSIDFGGTFSHGYLLIGALILIGVGLLLLSLVVNARVGRSVRADERHREKVFEYYRNTFSQLGVILIGIGVSLFIFFFQQNYQDQKRRETEVNQLLAKQSVRIGRAAALVRSLSEYDRLLDDGGPFVNPEDGGNNRAVTAKGADLAEQVRQIRLVDRDIDLEDFSVFNFSRDLEASTLITELDPKLWFAIVEDESDIHYATAQLAQDFDDLKSEIGTDPVASVLSDPEREGNVKEQVLDVLYDMDLLRDRARRLVGRACWFLSEGSEFLSLKAIQAFEDDYKSHREWIDQAEKFLTSREIGGGDCFAMLRYDPEASN